MNTTNTGHGAEKDVPWDHEFLPVAGHPDDDECTHREDGTDATYCGRARAEHLTDLQIAHLADDLGVRLLDDPRAENDAPCEPYITQDGYDRGQAFVCPIHDVFEPVIGENGRQTYEVTLARFQSLVAEHHARVTPPAMPNEQAD